MTVSDALRDTAKRLFAVAGADAAFEARQLVGYVLGRPLTGDRRAALSPAQEKALYALCARRLHHEPLQYLLGEWAFLGLPFYVTPEVLIPRADTETLALLAERYILAHGCKTVLDLCCGSGCIGIALGRRTGASVTAADISPGALDVTRRNAERNGVSIQTVASDLFAALPGRYDVIVTNPPYLSRQDMQNLQPELGFEPALALYGGADGLMYDRRIAAEWREHVTPGGALFLEIGASAADAVTALFGGGTVLPDLAGLPRVLCMEEACWIN